MSLLFESVRVLTAACVAARAARVCKQVRATEAAQAAVRVLMQSRVRMAHKVQRMLLLLLLLLSSQVILLMLLILVLHCEVLLLFAVGQAERGERVY